MAFTIAEKALTFFVSHEMFKLKTTLLDSLLEAYEPDSNRIEAATVSQAILKTLTQTILDASPRVNGNQESIFEEEPDLVAQLSQKSLRKFFEELNAMILALVDAVNDTSSK